MTFARKLLMKKVDRSKNTWFLFCEIFIKSKDHSKKFHLTPGRKVRRYTKNGKKKVWIFRPIDVFNLGFFKTDDLVNLTIYGILAWKDRQFFLFFMVLSKDNTLFEKVHCTKNPNFFLPKNRPTFRPGVICKFNFTKVHVVPWRYNFIILMVRP